MFDLQSTVARACRGEGLFAEGLPLILTAGGSQFPDLAAKRLRALDLGRNSTVIIRSGCYISHDSGRYAEAFDRMRGRDAETGSGEGGLVPALELWAYIQSRPQHDLAFATFGKRDTGTDFGMPVIAGWLRPGVHGAPQSLAPGHRVLKLNDQHAHLTLPDDSPLQVGDLVAIGISHPCTTFDKWSLIPIVDEAYNVVDALKTYF
jgi:D-serine dehydratase